MGFETSFCCLCVRVSVCVCVCVAITFKISHHPRQIAPSKKHRNKNTLLSYEITPLIRALSSVLLCLVCDITPLIKHCPKPLNTPIYYGFDCLGMPQSAFLLSTSSNGVRSTLIFKMSLINYLSAWSSLGTRV